jgi:peptide/nickel transport system permease protein
VTNHPWVRFVGQRVLGLVGILLGLILATFLMVRLIPGDAALAIGGTTATGEQLQQIRHSLGLDLPWYVQLGSYFLNVVQGNLGVSFRDHIPVTEVIAFRLRPSLTLAATSLLVIILLSVPLGMLAAALTKDGKRPRSEVAFAGLTSLVGSIPEFLMATFLAFIFAVWLRLLPVAGDEGWISLVLPVAAIALRPIAILMRIVRVETLNVLAQDYIRTARSKRLPERLIYARHALPNVLTATLTIGGLLFANLIAGAFVVENVFARPGLGTAMVDAIDNRDYPVIQGITLMLGVTVVIVNATVDILLGIVDPRSLTSKA